jgi:glycosyltransferase involved in cell wall biosynthesis
MRIGMIAPLEMRVPPVGYGGTELVVSLLTEELVRRGHDVTLFASGDSLTSAELVAGSPFFLRDSGRDSVTLTLLNVLACLDRADEFDIIHNHTFVEGVATAGLVGTPVLTTLHGAVEGDWQLLFGRYRGWYNTISLSAKRLLPEQERFVGAIYNGIDCASYPFNPGGREDYLLYLSRVSLEKGTHLAIEAARRLNKRLVIAGNIHAPDRAYFEREVAPHIDGQLIEYVGEVDQAEKRRLLAEASCLLAPITWDEPFGVFMVEAMVCGTPVIAMNRGSVPEVVRDGVTGFIVENVEEMCEVTARLSEVDPYACRRHVEENFSIESMTDNYLAAYRHVIEAAPRPSESLVREPAQLVMEAGLDLAARGFTATGPAI